MLNYKESIRLQEPSNVFTAELLAIYMSCKQIKNCPVGIYTIASDSMSAIEALINPSIAAKKSLLLYDCKKIMFDLISDNYIVQLMWVPAHKGIKGNTKVDGFAKEAAVSGTLSERHPEWHHFKKGNTYLAMMEWQTTWKNGELGRYCHSIIPKPSLSPWFNKFNDPLNRPEIRLLSRLAANHITLNDHLNRIQIVNTPFCHYCELNLYETPDHVLFICEAFIRYRQELTDVLIDEHFSTPFIIRDILAQTCKTNIIQAVFKFVTLAELKM